MDSWCFFGIHICNCIAPTWDLDFQTLFRQREYQQRTEQSGRVSQPITLVPPRSFLAVMQLDLPQHRR